MIHQPFLIVEDHLVSSSPEKRPPNRCFQTEKTLPRSSAFEVVETPNAVHPPSLAMLLSRFLGGCGGARLGFGRFEDLLGEGISMMGKVSN